MVVIMVLVLTSSAAAAASSSSILTIRRFVLGVDEPAPGRWPADTTFVPAVLTRDIQRDLRQHIDDGSIAGPSSMYRWVPWEKLVASMREKGLSARTQNSPFTVACVWTHRRAWTQVVASGADIGIVFEEDVVFTGNGSQDDYLAAVAEVATREAPSWDLVNVGRCWDFCQRQEVVANIGNHQKLVKSMAAGCTHAYLVSRRGALRLLSWSLPYVAPIDYLMQTLGRVGVVDAYAVTEPVFNQKRSSESHDPTGLKECDPKERETLKRVPDVRKTDLNVLKRMEDSWTRSWLRATYTPRDAHLFHTNSTPPVCQRLERFCTSSSEEDNARDPDEKKLLRSFDDLQLDTFLLWGLRPNELHTHRFIHAALNESLVRALVGPSNHQQQQQQQHLRQRRVCWVPSNVRLCDKVQRALVFASPKHAVFTRDPTLSHLPVSATNRYIFHELAPPQFKDLLRQGKVVEWVVRGPDGNSPALDAEHYALHQFARCEGITCFNRHVYVAPWAARVRPARAPPNSTSFDDTVVHFVGTVWHLNQRAFCDLVVGCNREGVKVIRHGLNSVPPNICGAAAEFEDDPRYVPEDEKRQLQNDGLFVPCFQGEGHLNGNNSYVSDRTIEAAALGLRAITNNQFSASILGLPYAPASKMCSFKHIPNASPRVARQHTYISRINDILTYFRLQARSRVEPTFPPEKLIF